MENPYAADPQGVMLNSYRNYLKELESRIEQLEAHVLYPKGQLATSTQQRHIDMHEQAARAQATEHLYAPLRSDTRAVIDLAAFARRLIDMQDLGHAVTEEVRQLAMRALGLK